MHGSTVPGAGRGRVSGLPSPNTTTTEYCACPSWQLAGSGSFSSLYAHVDHPDRAVRDKLMTGRASGSGDDRQSQPRARCNKVPGEEAEQAPRQRAEREAALSELRLGRRE